MKKKMLLTLPKRTPLTSRFLKVNEFLIPTDLGLKSTFSIFPLTHVLGTSDYFAQKPLFSKNLPFGTGWWIGTDFLFLKFWMLRNLVADQNKLLKHLVPMGYYLLQLKALRFHQGCWSPDCHFSSRVVSIILTLLSPYECKMRHNE